MLNNSYLELAITGAHTIALDSLPPIHKDPFDRILVAQALAEALTLLTADVLVSRYPGSIRLLNNPLYPVFGNLYSEFGCWQHNRSRCITIT